MIKEYITEHNGQFNVTKYTLSSGNEIYLNEDEFDELFYGSEHYDEIKLELNYLKSEIESQEEEISLLSDTENETSLEIKFKDDLIKALEEDIESDKIIIKELNKKIKKLEAQLGKEE